jgi:hypothetical protein
VQDAVAVLTAQSGDALKLVGQGQAGAQAHAHHEAACLAMLVHSHGHAEGAKGCGVDLATLEARHLGAKASHVLADARGEAKKSFGFHVQLLS